MKKLYFTLFILLPLLYSCKDNCGGIDCLSVDAFAFTIRSNSTGEDLLFSNNAQLGQDDVEIYFMQNGTKQPAQVRYMTDHVQVAIIPEITTYYVTALGQTDTLNLAISRTNSSGCCPSTTLVKQITVNNQNVPVDYRTIILTR
ncbi:hypothetical protein [Pontibacter vulgaris]|uniref:hypothetical protein n=1 Tax=Pontibacter vulgaris TaxID=2905679 RepID=UPI001FA6BDA3|nr:hypothetical protein [Pontibacter vulgaris]